MHAEAGIAIETVDLRKEFRLPHERRTTFKEHFLHPLKRTGYDVNTALGGVSFTVAAGEFFGVIGPNGSGKSTLLKILARIYPPTAGRVRVSGALSPFIELGVGFNPELDARDNVSINGTLLGLTSRELREKFDDIIEFAELEGFVNLKLKNYSSGMQLRLAYSIAIQVPFDILLLDEVLAVGDLAFQRKCYTTFERMRDEGKTLVFVSHDLDAVAEYCDRTLLLENGEARAIGPTEEVIEVYRAREMVR